MSASVIFGTVSALTKIGGYLDIIDSINNKLDRLVGMHLKAANYALESATRTSNKDEYIKYIDRARDKFIDAISVERKQVNLVQAYLGLAFCNHLVNDTSNMHKNLKEAKFHYSVLCNSLPDEDSLLQQMSGEGSGEGGTMEKTVISIVSLGAIPLISGIVEMVKEPIRNKKTREIESVKPIILEIDRIIQ